MIYLCKVIKADSRVRIIYISRFCNVRLYEYRFIFCSELCKFLLTVGKERILNTSASFCKRST